MPKRLGVKTSRGQNGLVAKRPVTVTYLSFSSFCFYSVECYNQTSVHVTTIINLLTVIVILSLATIKVATAICTSYDERAAMRRFSECPGLDMEDVQTMTDTQRICQ